MPALDSSPNQAGCLSIESAHRLASGEPPTRDQSSHLDVCPRCRAHLADIREQDQLARELAGVAASPGSPASSRPANAPAGSLEPGTRIGNFTITRPLGVGGMGMVYEAEQDSPRRLVALKLIKAEFLTPGVVRRFEHEAAALALLQHPGIAQVYQAGVAIVAGAERPFMALELVRGPSLDVFVRDTPLDLRRKLRILADVCDAADHAHRRGIVHRDLKPSNIIVTSIDSSGVSEHPPKILDFGVAKFRDDIAGAAGFELTREGAFVGTLAYAAPEQVSGDPSLIDARTDVYALGVMLYQLVTGRHPYALDRSLAEAVDTIRNARVEPARTHVPRLDADLELIMRTSLAADPARRYQSAALLADDLRRFMDTRPVRARPDSAWYILRKAVARHPYRAVTAAAIAALIAGSAASLSWLAIRSSRADRAKSLVLDATFATLELTDEDSPDSPAIGSVSEFLAMSRDLVRDKLPEYPEEQAQVLWRLGRGMLGQRDLTAAAETLEGVVAFRRRNPGPGSLRLADALVDLGRARYFEGNFEVANALVQEALSLRRRRLGDDDLRTIEALYWLGASLHGWKRYDQAEINFEQAVRRQRAIAPDSIEVGEYLTALAASQRGRGRYEQALATARQALEHVQRVRGPDAKHCAPALSNIIANLISLRLYGEAEPLLAESLRLRKQWYGQTDSRIADTLVQMAGLKMRLADRAADRGDAGAREQALVEGIAYARQTLELRRGIHPGDHESVAEALSILGQLLMRHEQLDDAKASLVEALEMRRRLPRQSDGDLGRSESNLGRCLARIGGDQNLAEAEILARTGLGRIREFYGRTHAFAVAALNNLAEVCEHADRIDEAKKLRDEAATIEGERAAE